ncbi:hypothetical protein VitviT2T_002932 [Vitis vinifera]|uniref:Uncharacterized protein n=1 Tax=Vitis vinifera TaxID=29760 RepID=A0ABY9BK02_VITVI|nr:hypothetical protein VitviT2T_002932 [Vitis vinifera]
MESSIAIYKARFQIKKAVRNEMSQYFFYTCLSDGKQRISFTYPPSLSIFLEMIQRRCLCPQQKDSPMTNYIIIGFIPMNKKKTH